MISTMTSLNSRRMASKCGCFVCPTSAHRMMWCDPATQPGLLRSTGNGTTTMADPRFRICCSTTITSTVHIRMSCSLVAEAPGRHRDRRDRLRSNVQHIDPYRDQRSSVQPEWADQVELDGHVQAASVGRACECRGGELPGRARVDRDRMDVVGAGLADRPNQIASTADFTFGVI